MSNHTRAMLAEIWRDLLGVQEIEPESDFFALGGDSVLAMTMLFRIGEQLGVQVDPGAVFAFSSLADLATEIDRSLASSDHISERSVNVP